MAVTALPEAGQLVTAEEVVRGIINTSSPTITEGSGFSVVKNSTGNVSVTFTTPFSDVPAIAANAEGAGDRSAALFGATAGSVAILRSIASTGVAEDGLIHFIAYIPSSGKTRVPRDFGLVTALPSTPTPQTGDFCTFTDSLTAPTFRWRFQYNGSSASAYKWEFIGGDPKQLWAEPARTITATAGGTPVPTDPLTFDLPRNGDYLVWGEAQLVITPNAVGALGVWGYAMEATALTSEWGSVAQCGSLTSGTWVLPAPTAVYRWAGCTAGDTITEQAYKNAAGTTYTPRRRSICIQPVRVG